MQDVTCASRESPGRLCPGRAGPEPWFNLWREATWLQIWAGFGGGLSPDTSLLLYFPSSTVIATPCSVFPSPGSPPFPAVGFASRPRRDSDVVESMRHKLGELTDLHGLKRLVPVWPQGC